MNNPVRITSEQSNELANLCYFFSQRAEKDGINPATLEVCQLKARLDYHEEENQWDRYEEVLELVRTYIKRGRSERFVDRGLIWDNTKRSSNPDVEIEPAVEHRFTDIGRRIDINWGGDWNTRHGSMATRNMWLEEVKLINKKFYESIEEENSDLSEGNWNDIVVAYMKYFEDIMKKNIMFKHKDNLPLDEAIAVAMLALCDFGNKLVSKEERLRARFGTAAYSWVRNYYRDAVDSRDVISMKSLQKVQDMRTLNDFLSTFKKELFRVPTIDEICKGTGFGELRVGTSMKVFDFNIGKYRNANEEEMLYTIMSEHLTERQASIIEMSYGLGGITPISLPAIAEELGIGRTTAQSERAKGIDIIKEHLSFKYENKRRL